MADVSKSQKLASARKKFKELKKKKNAAAKPNEEGNITQFIKEDTPVDSLTSSTHSSINEQVAVEQCYNENFTQLNTISYKSETAQLPNYFNNERYRPEPASFFDNISSNVDMHNVNQENNQSDIGIFNNPIEYDNPQVNPFNTYSFQYDTPFNEAIPNQEIQETQQNELMGEVALPPENVSHSADYSTDNITTNNTYFTENSANDSAKTTSALEDDVKSVSTGPNLLTDNFPNENIKETVEHVEDETQSEAQNENICQNYYSQTQSDNSNQQQQLNHVEDIPPAMKEFNLNLETSPQNDDIVHGDVSQETNIENDNIHEEFQKPPVFVDLNNIKTSYENVPSQPVSNMESLLQLSSQMAQLVEPNHEYEIKNELSNLAKRNLELATHLEKEKIKSHQLMVSIVEYQRRIGELECELNDKISAGNITEMNEISRLREELQSHIQTIGMLVAEKTEISANASQFEMLLKQKTTECEELQNRLKASRSRVADLERENFSLKEDMERIHHTESAINIQLSKVNEDFRKLKEEKDELYQDFLESKEKLKTTSENNLNLQKQIQELNSNLSLANIRIQQLTTTESQQVDVQVERLAQEKFTLEKQVADLTQTLKTVTKERDDSSSQYHQYTQQLNIQLTNLAKKLEQLQSENQLLVAQEFNRVKHIGELERQLQNLQNDQMNFSSNQRNNGDYKKEYLLAVDNFQTLEAKQAKLEESYTKVTNEKEMLFRDLESKKQTITHLENLLEQVRENQPDNTKLLAAMESDKVAASRAISQNIELKRQFEGLQEVLVKLNDDKLELTEKLTKETKINEDIMEDLEKTKLHLSTLADAIEIKDKELSSLRYRSEELNKQLLQQGQLTDRLRHYEAQNHSTQALQEELQEARNTIYKLTMELNELKAKLKSPEIEISPMTIELKNSEEMISVKTESAEALESNRIESNTFPLMDADVIQEMQEKLAKLELRNKHLEERLQEAAQTDVDGSETQNNGEKDDHLTVIDKEDAMKHLEEKFLKTMDEIAKLTDEKQRLEHLVLQLQGETETIGEYVALYQHQRNILKQRALEKDFQLKQLTEDRAQIKNKLDQLNMLVKQLAMEKGALPPQLFEQHENHNLCEEHSKIHQEINKITEENLTVDTNQHSNVDSETAERIIKLLSEIKTSNLVQPTENIHPCPWCSGKLITV